MKLITLLFFGLNAWGANTPPDLGNYTGLFFSGSALTHPVTIQGGTLQGCNLDSGSLSNIYKDCKVDGASVEVNLDRRGTSVRYNFTTASVIISRNLPNTHYYYRGTRSLDFGDQVITQPILAVFNMSSKNPKRVTGFIEITNSGTKSGFEAYRN